MIPGLIAVTLLAWASIELHTLPQLAAVSALMIAIVLGMLVRNTVGIPAACAPGIRFSCGGFSGSPSCCWVFS